MIGLSQVFDSVVEETRAVGLVHALGRSHSQLLRPEEHSASWYSREAAGVQGFIAF